MKKVTQKNNIPFNENDNNNNEYILNIFQLLNSTNKKF